MATVTPQRYRRLDTLPCAAAYADANGWILAANDAFHELWWLCGSSDEERTLFNLFSRDDRECVRGIVALPEALQQSSSRVARLAGSADAMIAEFVPIRRKSLSASVWLVMLRDASYGIGQRAAMHRQRQPHAQASQ